jgi:hypothetical protein
VTSPQRELQGAGEAVVSRSRLWINLVLVYWPTVSTPVQRQTGVLDQENFVLDSYPMMSYEEINKGEKYGNTF